VLLLLGIAQLAWVPAPAYFLLAYLKYSAFALLALALLDSGPRRWREFLPVLPVYFFYALAQVVPTTLGYANWVSLRLGGRRVFRDHYESDDGARRSGNGGAR
jgi:hypothetical protein